VKEQRLRTNGSPTTKPKFTVLVGHNGPIGESVEVMLQFELGETYDLQFFCFGDELGFDLRQKNELLNLTKTHAFDLIVVYCYMRLAGEEALFAEIKARYGKPMIVITAGEHDSPNFAKAGIDAFLHAPFILDDLRRVLHTCRSQYATTQHEKT
jgi:hypothetical protein